ncbi:MAG TPA: phosphodiester glycosidase family protein [Chloroflexaceae bacterium]|nr:phosphodiester glycosidase family protein [Chloroflexaceae bacterium]
MPVRAPRPTPPRALALLAAALLAACAPGGAAEGPTPGAQAPPAPLPTLMPTPTGAPAPPPGPTLAPADTGWLAAAPGAELRRLRVSVAGQEAPVSVVRLDPALVRFSVGYSPDERPPLSVWAARAGALAVINGGFFDADGRSVALLVHGGRPVGASYEGRGGMFAVAPDGAVSLRALADAPYDPAEPLAEALQGWPVLVRPGGVAAYTYEDGARDRRSALGLDREGRVLLIAAPTAAFTLAELSAWLAAADLGLDSAVNLDGGASTGLMLLSAEAPERIDAFSPLPIVLIAHPR